MAVRSRVLNSFAGLRMVMERRAEGRGMDDVLKPLKAWGLALQEMESWVDMCDTWPNDTTGGSG